MIYCKYIVNMYNKHKNVTNDIVYNEVDHIHQMSMKQKPNIIYLYKFSNGAKYLSVNSDNTVIEKINDPVILEELRRLSYPT